MTNKKTLSVASRYWGELQFEDLPSEELEHGLAIANSPIFHWVIFDIKSGLTIVRGCRTRKIALEEYEEFITDKDSMNRLDKSRASLTYKDRCLELERHKLYV